MNLKVERGLVRTQYVALNHIKQTQARSAFGLGMKHDRISPPYLWPDLMFICNMTEKFIIE